MIQAKCIQKFRDKNNHIYGYRLVDINGQTQDVQPNNLKQAIANKQIHVVNLTLTSDGRLVDTTEKQLQSKKLGSAPQQTQQKSEEQQIKELIVKAKLIGLPVKDIQTACGHKCKLISLSSNNHIIYIPDDVTKLNDIVCFQDDVREIIEEYDTYNDLTFTLGIESLQGKIKVIGGKNLKDTFYMFSECQAQEIDLSMFDTRNITEMKWMFHRCKAQLIKLSYFNTKKVTDMEAMFVNCEASILDLSSFDTSNVVNMEAMFAFCKAKKINLSSFKTSNTKNMIAMFEQCEAQSLDLSSFNTSNVTDMIEMFYECKAQIKATDLKILEAYNNRLGDNQL